MTPILTALHQIDTTNSYENDDKKKETEEVIIRYRASLVHTITNEPFHLTILPPSQFMCLNLIYRGVFKK